VLVRDWGEVTTQRRVRFWVTGEKGWETLHYSYSENVYSSTNASRHIHTINSMKGWVRTPGQKIHKFLYLILSYLWPVRKIRTTLRTPCRKFLA